MAQMLYESRLEDALIVIFCLRLPFGLLAPLLLLNPDPIPPRFFRIQFLVALGLLSFVAYIIINYGGVAGSGGPDHRVRILWYSWMFRSLTVSAVLCFLGCIVWHLRDAPFGGACITFSTLSLGLVLLFSSPITSSDSETTLNWWRLADNYASAAMFGISTSAMLLGHSYLISPNMTIAPLQRLLIAFAVALALRVTLACWGLWFWTAEHPIGNLDKETLLWLSARWLLGILAPLVLGWMAWETARIRSTQSATGILYVVVIVTFLGELTSLLLLEKTGYPL